MPMLEDNEIIGPSLSIGNRYDLSPISRSSWSRVLPAKQSSPSRMRGCSKNCASALLDVTERTTDLTEALEQQTATSEVLLSYLKLSGDLQPAFATMLEKAIRTCDATFGDVYRSQGSNLSTRCDAKYSGSFRRGTEANAAFSSLFVSGTSNGVDQISRTSHRSCGRPGLHRATLSLYRCRR